LIEELRKLDRVHRVVALRVALRRAARGLRARREQRLHVIPRFRDGVVDQCRDAARAPEHVLRLARRCC
jgi:hypothetical protein